LAFLKIYENHISRCDSQRALDTAAEIARNAATVLLCYERNPKQCHRTIVAEQLLRRDTFEIRHLGVAEVRNPLPELEQVCENGALANL